MLGNMRFQIELLSIMIILAVDRRSHVSMSIFTSGRSYQFYGPIITSAAFPCGVILLGAHCL